MALRSQLFSKDGYIYLCVIVVLSVFMFLKMNSFDVCFVSVVYMSYTTCIRNVYMNMHEYAHI